MIIRRKHGAQIKVHRKEKRPKKMRAPQSHDERGSHKLKETNTHGNREKIPKRTAAKQTPSGSPFTVQLTRTVVAKYKNGFVKQIWRSKTRRLPSDGSRLQEEVPGFLSIARSRVPKTIGQTSPRETRVERCIGRGKKKN